MRWTAYYPFLEIYLLCGGRLKVQGISTKFKEGILQGGIKHV